ncbi:hypothetical protein CFC21_034858 [Triticum aestivum]|uniref:Exonuclease domain-containing protein n=2 Tax=Triticum aestivum TaxID=4565 RepID=A0A9R1F4B7_WHEAT|nr:hypothetical protein CFC21_034858 [Triticum aestivum]
MAARGQGLEQDFDFFVVVDFEATCVKDGRIFPQEIIEFPAVLVDGATGRIESAFRRYVRPKHHPVLTEFCRELTGIRQEDVDGGVELGDALWLHDSWLKAATAGAGNKASAWPWAGRVNLQEAVRAAGLDWEGRLHCGLDDALNTARLLAEIMRRGVKITITGSLAPPPPIQQKQQPGASPCGGSPALAPPPIQQQPPRTGPCSGTFAPVPAQAPIQQKQQQPPQPHIISPCGGSSATCFSYCGVATRGAMEPGPMPSGCANWTPAMGPYFLWSN